MVAFPCLPWMVSSAPCHRQWHVDDPSTMSETTTTVQSTLPETNVFAPENRPKPNRKGSYSNHPFVGAMLVSGRVDWSNNWDSENSNPVIHRFISFRCQRSPICFNHPPFFSTPDCSRCFFNIRCILQSFPRIPNHHSQLPNPSNLHFWLANWEGFASQNTL